MSSTKANQKRLLAGISLLLLLCGGCLHQGQRLRTQANATCCWQVVDPTCYGYHPTCWRTWPDECEMCVPPDGMAPQIYQSKVVNPAHSDLPPMPPISEEIQTPSPLILNGDKPTMRMPVPSEIDPEPSPQQPSSGPSPPVLQNPNAAHRPEFWPPISAQANAW
jgi:hypothetical protein